VRRRLAFESKLPRELVKAVLESPAAIIDSIPGVAKNKKEAYNGKAGPNSSEPATKQRLIPVIWMVSSRSGW